MEYMNIVQQMFLAGKGVGRYTTKCCKLIQRDCVGSCMTYVLFTHPAIVNIPPNTQKIREVPTLSVFATIKAGVLNIPVPTTRLTIKSAVDVTPSLRSVFIIDIGGYLASHEMLLVPWSSCATGVS